MNRRKRWTMLVLLLLPTAIAIATFSVARFGENNDSTGSSQLPVPHEFIRQDAAFSELATPDAIDLPTHAQGGRHIDSETTEPSETNNEHDLPELEELFAYNYAAPPYAFDSYFSPEDASGNEPTDGNWNSGRGFRNFNLGLIGDVGGGGSSTGSTHQNISNGRGDSRDSESPSNNSSSDTSNDNPPQYGDTPRGDIPPAFVDEEDTSQPPVIAVPEPSTWSLFGLGLLGLMVRRRQRV